MPLRRTTLSWSTTTMPTVTGFRSKMVGISPPITIRIRAARSGVSAIRTPPIASSPFDGNGNALTRTDGKGQVTTFVYDKEDRLTQRKYGAVIDFTNTWRSDGLISQRVDPTGTYTWGYNGAKQLTSTFQPIPNKTVTYTYDTG